MMSTMHPVRRRKKRPNYGVRSVEVNRGQNGFGFTISGQHPCILSCIVAGSPAEAAGLRAGDYLVAVQGRSVSKVPHDQVVRLINCSTGILKLQIAENYYSDSSDDEVLLASRQKPKYPHKYRSNCRYSTNSQNRSLKDCRNASFDEHVDTSFAHSRSIKQFFDHWKLSNRIPPPASRFQLSGVLDCCSDVEEEVFRAVVGYIGTIEMPRKLPVGSRLQIVQSCIKKLKTEKRTHTTVLMKVMTQSLRLINGAGITLAVYPGERVTFCGSSSDKDHKHFGVVTTVSGENPSSSCHVFAVDARPHSNHSKRAKIFKLECHMDPVSGQCKEFPSDCEPIVSVIRGFYESDDLPLAAGSPQPSHDSTTTTSNSDSGIGYRDDCGIQSDRILVVDIQNQRLHIQEMNERGGEKLTVRTLANALPGRSPSALSTGSEGQIFLEDMSVSSGTTKSPDVTVVSKHRNNFSEYSLRSMDDMSIGSARSNDALSQSYKLSPKVYGITANTSQSLEDLKDSELSDNQAAGNPQWGSLQDLRSFTLDPFRTPDDPAHHDGESGVSSWATSFEKLLEDKVGLHKFSEFLKKEFSHENIYFWVSCEKYRLTEDRGTRRRLAREIYDRHMGVGALEPVNVDARARQVTQEQVSNAQPDLFLQAQKQIFNLMKFDSYPRFIKSDLYKECVVKVLSGEPIDFDNDSELSLELPGSSSLQHSKLKKSRSDADERRRRSLLPWNRKSRTKSRDRRDRDIVSEPQDNLDNTSVSSSRSSLTAWDVTHSATMCRVVLPDNSTAVVHTKPDYTVHHVIVKLLEKRGLSFSDFQVFLNYNNKCIDVREDCMILSGQEVRVEQRVTFKLDLPNSKTVMVKSKLTKTLGDVVHPILRKYGYRPENITLCLTSENEVIDFTVRVSSVDNGHIQVLTRNLPPETPQIIKEEWRPPSLPPNKGKSLDEITNSVFEQLLHDKAEASVSQMSDQASIRSEDWGSENSSSILGRFLRRDSAFIDKRKIKKGKGDDSERKSTLGKFPPLIAKFKPKVEARSESDVLYEGLKRAQRCRLEDQRGTEINFELPDFLKDKENTPQAGKKLRTHQHLTATDHAIHPKVFVPSTSTSNTCSDAKKAPLQDSSLRISDSPPPLPPKPKNLTSGWTTAPPTEPKPLPRTLHVYLDQPSSSFV